MFPLALLALALWAGPAVPALAQAVPVAAPAPLAPSTSPDNPTPLTAPFTATLVGSSPAGVFHYYRMFYPGDGSGVTLVLTFNPSDPAVAAGVGMTAFQDGRQLLTIAGNSNYCTGTISGVVSSGSNSPVLVYVYSYVPTPLNYTLTPAGLPQPPQPGQPVRDRTRAEGAVPLLKGQAATVSGSLPGSSGGSFNYYSLAQPGDGSTITLSLGYYPFDAITANGVGLNLYGTLGTLLASVSGRTANPNFDLTYCNRWATLTYVSKSTEPLLVQVYNYTPGITVGYTLTRT